MAENELLYGLIGLGVGGVLLVFGFNAWQENRHRRAAEKAFRAEHRDVLLEGDALPPTESPPPDKSGRIEPASSRVPPATPIGRATEPELPVEVRAIDCLIRIEAPAGIIGGQLVTGAGGPLSQLNRPVRWFGLCEETHAWLRVDNGTGRTFSRLAATLQLADRRGPVNDRELDAFISGVQRACDQFMAVATVSDRAETLTLARQVDQFCAAVDIQIAVNVVSTTHPFPGTKLRGLAESAGLRLERDGCFHAHDERGNSLFVLGNRDAALFSPDALRQMVSQGLTLSLDVPRVPLGVDAFDRMIALARQLADALHGTVVDDNLRPLGEQSVAVIRGQIQQFQEQMDRHGIPAGGELATRLFA